MPPECYPDKPTIMPQIKDIQDQSASLRKEQERLDISIHQNKAELERLQEKANHIKGKTAEERRAFLAQIQQEKERLLHQKNLLFENHKNLRTAFADLRRHNLVQVDPQVAVEELDDRFPILLFPLRLETRFKNTGNQPQLWIRVYPDDCNVVKKEPLLTTEELENARSFWIEMAKAGGTETEEKGAWTVLVNSHGSNRAAWVITQYQPLNERPARPNNSHKILVVVSEDDTNDDLPSELAEYWRLYWLAQGDPGKIQEAFEQLRQDLGLDVTETRQKIDSLTPVNISDEAPEEITPDKIAVVKLNLPDRNRIITTQGSWNHAPQAISLPDKFVAVTYNGNIQKSFVFENPVRESLPVGIDPTLEKGEQISKTDDNEITLNEDLQWMTDFDKAVEAGMATRINLSSEEASGGFDKLFVLGLRLTSDAQRGKEELEKLITLHKNSHQGFSFIPQGTATNNTENGGSGYSWTENPDDSYYRLFKGTQDFTENAEYTKQADAQRFATSLGIDPAILQSLPNANGRDQAEAYAMNMALFPATLGYFMEEMMDPLFNENSIEATKQFFSEYVSGRGPIPAIRIGRQPYGILPVTAFSRLHFREKHSFTESVYRLVNKIDTTWNELVSQVSYVGKSGDAHQVLLDVLGLHANSVEFHQRYSQSIQYIYNQLNQQLRDPFFAASVAAAIASRGRSILQELGIDSTGLQISALEKYFLSQPTMLRGPLVDDIPESEILPIRAYSADNRNYIEWLRTAEGNQVRLQDFGGNPAPNALLYLLLRHAVMLSQSSAATNLLVSHDVIRNKKEFFDPPFLHIQENQTGKSKFEHLYQPNAVITGNSHIPLVQHIYSPDVLNHLIQARELKETLDALRELEKTPTARLERLLTEHLDCCSYRIDAWKTGLVQYKLMEQRSAAQQNPSSQGTYLGAYGWLTDVRPKHAISEEVTLDSDNQRALNPDGKKLVRDNSNLGYIHAPSIDQAATAAILRNAYDSHKSNGSQNPFAINLTSERIRMAHDFLEGMRNGQSLAALLGYQFERGLHDRYSTTGIEADKFIYPLRMAFPLVAENLKSGVVTSDDIEEAQETNPLSDTSKTIETIEARNVIDGLKLIRHVQQASVKTYPFGLPGKYQLPSASTEQTRAITEEVNRLMDIHDAIADLVMSEQVYQAVKGNFDRAAGVADAFSKGTYPPEMEVINTPRTGLALTHKLALHFNAAADPSVSPNSLAVMTPRASLEPAANEWISGLFPDPENVQCKVLYTIPGSDPVAITVSQKDLGLQSIDLLYMAHFDTEQTMTALDDRIVNFVRYSITHHPFTGVEIAYTEDADVADRSVVTFFELAAMIQSLRKILIGHQQVMSGTFGLPTGEMEEQKPLYDHTLMGNRLTALRDDTEILKGNVRSLMNSTKSISALIRQLDLALASHGLDESERNAFTSQLTTDLKSYLSDPSAGKDEFLAAYTTNISTVITDATVTDTLRTQYGNLLDEYHSDFAHLDTLLKDTCALFMKIALYDHTQTGTGFIHQAVAGIYDGIIGKTHTVTDRWTRKKESFDDLMSTYDASLPEEELFSLLQKAERMVSTQSTFSASAILSDYKSGVEAKGNLFNAVLNDLISLASGSNTSITGFLGEAETILSSISAHDIVNFDTENSRNDLYTAKQALVILKEDVYMALENMHTFLDDKIHAFDTEMEGIATLTSDADIIARWASAAKKIMGEEVLVLPRFRPTDAKANELESLHAASDSLLDFVRDNEKRVLPVDDWFAGVARVRKNAWEYENIMSLCQGFHPGSTTELTPLQFPFKENDRWLALKFVMDQNEEGYDADIEKPFEDLRGDALLYTVHLAKPYDKTDFICGIVIDEWTEVIPSKEETTGITFHYDQPNSEPPQTMLLVVPPFINGKWEWNDIVDALEETWEMARKRAVEPSMVDSSKLGQFLPATMMAITSHWITIATNLAINNIHFSEP